MKNKKTKKAEISQEKDESMEVDEVENEEEEKNIEYGEVIVPPALPRVATYDPNGPRLMISHIVNENFKSYAGKQVLGPFHKSFTSIVGPNGSGKSNVIDSMLFVFGYRANKIRSKKISILIHNSENHLDIQSCTVSVHFQIIVDLPGDDDYDVVPNSQFVVSRTAYRDNSSTYSVDGRKMTYKEVAALLRSKGIDLDHNRFLILQGEVEQISMMKPKALTEHDEGMLEFLEDIIGSSRFKEPIEVLTKRIEDLNELRGEKLNRVKAVEKEKDDLEGPKNDAIEFLMMENDVTKKKHFLYQKYTLDCKENEKQAMEKWKEIKDSMAESQAVLEEILSKKKEQNENHKKIYKTYENLVKQCEECKAQFTDYEKQDAKCQEDLKLVRAKAKKLEKSLEAEKLKFEEFKLAPSKNNEEIKQQKEEKQKLEGNLKVAEENLERVMSTLKSETQDVQDLKDNKEQDLMDLKKSVNEMKSKVDILQSELDLYLSNQKNEQNKLEVAEKNLENTCKRTIQLKSSIDDLNKNIPETEAQLEVAQTDFKSTSVEEAKILEELKTKRIIVEEARISFQASRSKGKVLESLMQQKENGSLPGIYGRLGDLGAIDEKYDIAISTACGALDHIVVDTIDTAQKCVEFLKKNNIGFATFIGLDKLGEARRKMTCIIKTPENVPRLFDLVRVKNEEILPAFYFALDDTLVANDLNQATKLAFQGNTRWRVVSLNGELIDQSGTMSGGGNKVMKGRMGTAVISCDYSPQQLEEMEKSLSLITEESQQLRQKKFKLEDTIGRNRQKLQEMKHSLDKQKLEYEALLKQESCLETQIKDQKQKVLDSAPDKNKLKEIEKTLASYKKDYEKAESAAAVVEDAVQKLQKQIVDITTSKLKEPQSQIDSLSKKIDEMAAAITKATVACKTAERNIKKSEEKIASMEDEIKENKNTIVKLESKFKQLEDDGAKILIVYQEDLEKIKDLESKLNIIKSELSQLEMDENKLNEDFLEVNHNLEKYETLVKDNQQKIKYWEKEMGKLSLHVIDNQPAESLNIVPVEELQILDVDGVHYQMSIIEEKLLKSKPNMAAIAEYKKKEALYLQRVAELDEITERRDGQRQQQDSLRKQRLDEFMVGFSIITSKLKEMYQMLTLGGDAELELVDSLDPFSEGVVFSVRPPKKSWKNISNLSGGEKTLSSLALVFALHHFKPTPLYVMDEIDAALDFKNVSIVANYIKERTKNAQFIIISLRNNMFELADRLVGIYKTDNCTKSCTINPKKIILPIIKA